MAPVEASRSWVYAPRRGTKERLEMGSLLGSFFSRVGWIVSCASHDGVWTKLDVRLQRLDWTSSSPPDVASTLACRNGSHVDVARARSVLFVGVRSTASRTRSAGTIASFPSLPCDVSIVSDGSQGTARATFVRRTRAPPSFRICRVVSSSCLDPPLPLDRKDRPSLRSFFVPGGILGGVVGDGLGRSTGSALRTRCGGCWRPSEDLPPVRKSAGGT